MLCGAGCCTELLKVTHLALKSLINHNESRVSADVNKTAFDLMQYFFVNCQPVFEIVAFTILIQRSWS